MSVESLSADDIAFYDLHGWFVTGPLVPHELLDELRDVIEAHQHRPDLARLPDSIGHADWSPGKPGTRNSEFLSYQEPEMRRLLLPSIAEIAAHLAGTDRIRLFDDQAVVKPGGTDDSVVGWHTDHSYWSTCTSTTMLTAWVPFDDCSAADGTLLLLDGSHRWENVEHLRGFNDPDLDAIGTRLGRRLHDNSVVALELAKGQVSFHHMRLAHGSGANRADRRRIAVAIHLQTADNRHRDAFGPDGTPVVLPHDRLARTVDGRPDYTDPRVFPVLWDVSW